MLNANEQVAITHDAVEAFCREFVTHPYLCYTEHGLHALFFARLYAALPEHGRYAEWADNRICLVQKEYPTAASLGKPRRQHWDVAVLRTPLECLRDLPARHSSFDYLRLATAVEFGLNYGATHLVEDVRRLSHDASNVDDPVVVHLYRFSKPGAPISGRDMSPAAATRCSLEDAAALTGDGRVTVYYGVADMTDPHASGLWRVTAGDANKLV